MMAFELGILPDDRMGITPFQACWTTIMSFIGFGSIPLIPYIIGIMVLEREAGAHESSMRGAVEKVEEDRENSEDNDIGDDDDLDLTHVSRESTDASIRNMGSTQRMSTQPMSSSSPSLSFYIDPTRNLSSPPIPCSQQQEENISFGLNRMQLYLFSLLSLLTPPTAHVLPLESPSLSIDDSDIPAVVAYDELTLAVIATVITLFILGLVKDRMVRQGEASMFPSILSLYSNWHPHTHPCIYSIYVNASISAYTCIYT